MVRYIWHPHDDDTNLVIKSQPVIYGVKTYDWYQLGINKPQLDWEIARFIKLGALAGPPNCVKAN